MLLIKDTEELVSNKTYYKLQSKNQTNNLFIKKQINIFPKTTCSHIAIKIYSRKQNYISPPFYQILRT